MESQIRAIVDHAIKEDLGQGDVTTDALIPPALEVRASILVKASGVLAGIEVAEIVFQQVDPSLIFERLVQDGTGMQAGSIVGVVTGKAAGILKAERVALNFLQHLSGIATETAKYVAAVAGTRARILDTRKTTPGLRLLEKYAVRTGGGQNHRQNLGDGVLIKDNHLAALRAGGVGLGEVIKRARANVPRHLKIEVEVDTVEQAQIALDAGADILLLDNMRPADMHRVVELVDGRALTEASGGITLDNVRAVAETGVDFISIGTLTHSVKALDISIEFRI
ncbi:carboxylating nicotinate-nucleotide diphosphorylase [Dehalococcoidia bacterium]|nr:carboxylating nicotinate-nucleotide diphosphorylase [Dehalococcoidia bacterium]MCL0076099.1 carboxylating nicotinate-nucleotide diphosphorylase [Dehalococcoidia bacterium]